MGNCLKITNVDDISLLRGGSSDLGSGQNASDSTAIARGGSISDASSGHLSQHESGQDFNTEAPISAPLIYSDLLQPVFLQNVNNLPPQAAHHHGYTSAGIGGGGGGGGVTTMLATTAATESGGVGGGYGGGGGGFGVSGVAGFGGNTQLSEEEQIRIAKRIGLIQHLPIGTYDGGTTKNVTRECVICMIEFCINEPIRYLPCMHAYHVRCIDDWLMRSLTCPSCMVPVDAALLLISFET